MSVEYAISLMITGWIFGFVFGWVMKDWPRQWGAAIMLTAGAAALVALALGLAGG